MDISYAGAEKSHGGGSSKALSHLSQLEAPDSDDDRIGQGGLDLITQNQHIYLFKTCIKDASWPRIGSSNFWCGSRLSEESRIVFLTFSNTVNFSTFLLIF